MVWSAEVLKQFHILFISQRVSIAAVGVILVTPALSEVMNKVPYIPDRSTCPPTAAVDVDMKTADSLKSVNHVDVTLVSHRCNWVYDNPRNQSVTFGPKPQLQLITHWKIVYQKYHPQRFLTSKKNPRPKTSLLRSTLISKYLRTFLIWTHLRIHVCISIYTLTNNA